jgi:ABC-type branched-subunit amino acid transport system permease subunit
MNREMFASPIFKRLMGCLAGSLVLALMIGPQEGTPEDYGYAFRQAILRPRVFVFLAIGVLIFILITYRPLIAPYFSRPGAPGLCVGIVTVIAALVLLRWDDAVGDAKFGAVSSAVGNTSGLSWIASAFFGWLHWTMLGVVGVIAAVAVALRIRRLAWVAAALAVIAGIIAFVAHHQVISFSHATDHSFGAFTALMGYLLIAVACGAAATSQEQAAHVRDSIDAALAWRPGLPLVVIGAIATLIAMTTATWFSPLHLNANLLRTHDDFSGYGLNALSAQYLAWLSWVLLVVVAAVALAGTYLRHRGLAWAATGIGLVGVVLTLITLYDISKIGAANNVDAATGPWQNLGSGGWLACMGMSLMAAGAFVAARSGGAPISRDATHTAQRAGESESPAGFSLRSASGASRNLLLVGVILAVFLPPTMTQFWQKVLISEIGVYVLLAIGLNVVVGWAGLLDLGFIAFYAIGSYTTAYLVGSLPHKPPAWLHMTPLLAIPFAIAVCLIAGVALGAPTLRLRGDYLAIVTLGFGEIIRITAINNPGSITNSTRGPSPAVTHPSIRLGPLHIKWGQNNLQYWYLLLALLVIVVILFYRLEGSRLGRAWAAIREDEVAAQASGINTPRVKLLAFAIGASTSGLAGVFFASQIGYFNPDNFLLNNSILVVAYVVFGGMGSLPGAMAGAAVLTWLPEFLKDQVPANDRQMWIGALVLLMMIFRPAGLIPAKRRKAELAGMGAPLSAETHAVAASEGL